jgi:hypothetical protein
MNQSTEERGEAMSERRKRPDLRNLFDAVVRHVAPFFEENAKLNGSRTDFWVVRTISDGYPQLNNEEAHVLAKAAIRYFQERK